MSFAAIVQVKSSQDICAQCTDLPLSGVENCLSLDSQAIVAVWRKNCRLVIGECNLELDSELHRGKDDRVINKNFSHVQFTWVSYLDRSNLTRHLGVLNVSMMAHDLWFFAVCPMTYLNRGERSSICVFYMLIWMDRSKNYEMGIILLCWVWDRLLILLQRDGRYA